MLYKKCLVEALTSNTKALGLQDPLEKTMVVQKPLEPSEPRMKALEASSFPYLALKVPEFL
jgi:hypothetical protein